MRKNWQEWMLAGQHTYTASGRGIGSDLPVDPRSLEGHPKEIYQEVVVLYNVDDVDIDLLREETGKNVVEISMVFSLTINIQFDAPQNSFFACTYVFVLD